MMARWTGECQVNVKSQSELVFGKRETCLDLKIRFRTYMFWVSCQNVTLFNQFKNKIINSSMTTKCILGTKIIYSM